MSSFQSQSKRVPSPVGAGHGVLRGRLRKDSRPAFSPLTGGARYVLDRDASACARALHLGEVYPQLLCLLPGGIRGVGFLLPASPGGVLSLLSGLPRGILGLLGRPLGGVLGLLDGPSGGVLCLPGGLSHGLLWPSSTFLVPTGELLGGLSDGLGDLLDGLPEVGNLQVEDAPVGAELQGDEAAGLVLYGARRLTLFVGGLLIALRRWQVGDVAHYVLVHEVA